MHIGLIVLLFVIIFGITCYIMTYVSSINDPMYECKKELEEGCYLVGGNFCKYKNKKCPFYNE